MHTSILLDVLAKNWIVSRSGFDRLRGNSEKCVTIYPTSYGGGYHLTGVLVPIRFRPAANIRRRHVH